MSNNNEIRGLVYPTGEVVCWSPKYAKREIDFTDPAAPAIMVGLFQCEMAEPEPVV